MPVQTSAPAALTRRTPYARALYALGLVLLAAGTLAAAANLVGSARIALFGTALYQPSIDFQWSPAHLFLHHTDPWQVQLAGNPDRSLILGQQPNYLHFIYLFFAPFGALSFAHARALWLVCNLAFTVAGLLLVSRFYRLSRLQSAIAVILLTGGVSFSVALANGQQTFLVFLFFALALCRTQPPSPLWTGFSYFKYSFGPPMFFLMLVRKGWRGAAWSLLPFAAGFLLVRAWLSTPTLTLLLEPLRVSTTVVGPGFEDLMTLLLALHLPGALAYALPILLCAAAVWYIARPRSGYTDGAVVAATALMGTLFFKHLGYDNVMLLFPVCYALRSLPGPPAATVLAGAAYFWYGVRLVHRFLPAFNADHLLVPNFLIAAALLVAVLRMEPREVPHPSSFPRHLA